MTTATITRTKEYLVIKIPLRNVVKRSFSVSLKDQALIHEGLRAVEEGRVSKRFKTTREAASFLRKL